MRFLKSYCDKVGAPCPTVRRARLGELVGGAVARADYEKWAILTRDDPNQLSPLLGAHELAHLFTDADGDRGDSHQHGPRFQTHMLAIENHIRDEMRRELRAMRASAPLADD